jgi:phage baseplate assembly protein W
MANGSLPLRGIAFPFRIDPRSGGVAATEGPHKLTENLERLLLARIGERLMLRDYGGGASALVQENINDGLIAVARNQIAAAILRYEPRVLPQDVSVIPNEGELFVRVQFIQAELPGVQTTAIRVG